MLTLRTFAALTLLSLLATTARGDVVRVNVISRHPLLGGRAFGKAGAHEVIVATIDYAVDPAKPHNSVIIDLDRASRNASGRVEFTGDILILRPADGSRGNGIALLDVVKRDGRTVLTTFNHARAGGDLTSDEENWRRPAAPARRHGRSGRGALATSGSPGRR